MAILESLRRRIGDFEKVMAIIETHEDCKKDFEMNNIRFQGFDDWLCWYTGRYCAFYDDDLYRAERLEFSSGDKVEYLLFFEYLDRIDYVLGDERMILTEYPSSPEYEALKEFYKFSIWCNAY